MVNVITVIFSVQSEAYQALSELRQNNVTQNYTVAEAALLKSENGTVHMLDGFDTGARTGDDTAAGLVVGSLVGILGGPLGVLLGASYGALLGGTIDAGDAIDDASALEIMSGKLYNGEVAIVALVEEAFEPAFDEALASFETTIIRQDAADVAAELDRARELEAEMARQAKEQMRAERKAERKAKTEETKASITSYFEGVKKDYADRKAKRAAERDKQLQDASSAVQNAFDSTVDALRARADAAVAKHEQKKADAASARLERGAEYLKGLQQSDD